MKGFWWYLVIGSFILAFVPGCMKQTYPEIWRAIAPLFIQLCFLFALGICARAIFMKWYR
jgi:hypothetical protein